MPRIHQSIGVDGGVGVVGVKGHKGHQTYYAPANSSEPVRYFDGIPIVSSTDLASDDFGTHFAVTRSWSGYLGGQLGTSWEDSAVPQVHNYDGDTVAIVAGGTSPRFYDASGGTWTARDYLADTLTQDPGTGDLTLRDTAGNQLTYSGVNDLLQGVTEAGTDVTTAVSYTSDQYTLTRTFRQAIPGTTNDRVTQEQYSYDRNSNQLNQVDHVTLRRRSYDWAQGTGGEPTEASQPYTDVRRVYYDYYETYWTPAYMTLTLEGGLPGQMGDLRTASITDPAAEQTVSSITSSGTTATVTLNGHGFHAGDTVVLSGADKIYHNAYNGTFVISSVTTNTFQVTLDSSHTGTDTGASLRAVRPLETSYYRYWQAQTHMGVVYSPLRTVVTGESYARMRAAGVNPFLSTTTDADLMPYVDHYFRYEAWEDREAYTDYPSQPTHYKDRFRVIEEVAQGAGCSACTGGQGTFKFSYAVNPTADTDRNSTQYNTWRYKTIEYLPDSTNTPSTGTLSAGSLQSSGTTATVTRPNTFHAGNRVTITGADQAEYNGTFEITTATSTNFSFKLLGVPSATTATGTIAFSVDTQFDDNDKNIVYCNEVGQPMLQVFEEEDGNDAVANRQWVTANRYDSQGRLIWVAAPSAVSGYDETKSDLLDFNAGTSNFQYLRDAEGVIETTQYYVSTDTQATTTTAGGVTGYYKSTSVKRGETGTAVLQHSQDYIQCTAGSLTTYLVNSENVYPDGSTAQTTTYGYTWYSGTVAPSAVTTTYPVVTEGQNGPGTADTFTTYLDKVGRTIFTTDGDGVVDYYEYDNGTIVGGATTHAGTGALTKVIQDADTSQTTDFSVAVPSGLASPSGTRLRLTTATVVDKLGRECKVTEPNGNVTYTVYNDAAHEVRTYQGWQAYNGTASSSSGTTVTDNSLSGADNAYVGQTIRVITGANAGQTSVITAYNASTHTLTFSPAMTSGTNPVTTYELGGTTGPVLVARQYRPDGGSGEIVYNEALTTTAAPTLSNGAPTGGETISAGNITSLIREFTNKAGQHTFTDAYFDLTSQTYTRGVTADSNQVPSDLGTKDTHFHRTQYGYNKRGLQDKLVDGAGTITRIAYDAKGRVKSTWVGTDDTGWTEASTSHSNMVKVSENWYDNDDPGVTGDGIGDSNLTKTTEYPGGGASSRDTLLYYDWRDRAVAGKFGTTEIVYADLDNLGRTTAGASYDASGVTFADTSPADGVPDRPATSKRRALVEYSYDAQGRVYQERKYGIDASTGTASSGSLKSNVWYDRRGNVIKTSEPGGMVYKYQFDAAGRPSKSFVTDGGAATGGPDPAAGTTGNWSDADDVAGDNVLEQTEYLYDLAKNAVLVTTRQRFHDEADTNDLTTSGVDDRASYVAQYFDRADRPIYSVDYGTNGGTAVTAVDTINSWPSAALVTKLSYRATDTDVDTGELQRQTDPMGIVAKTEYDLLGRVTRTTDAYVNGTAETTDSGRTDDDQITEYTYNANGDVKTLKAVLVSGGASQTTEYVYGVTTGGGSDLNSNDLLLEVRYPDKTTGAAGTGASDKNSYKYNALGQAKEMKDQNETVHAYAFDVQGRQVSDAVTLKSGNPSNVGSAVLRLETAYDEVGRPYKFTSYNATSGGSVVNEVKREFNGLSQMTSEWQDHNSAVNSDALRVRYTYSEDYANNHSRLTGVVYPDGRTLAYGYAAGVDDKFSRVSHLSDTSAASANLEQYSYLGLGTIVERIRPETGVRLTYVTQSTGNEPSGAGDKYTGLDRFGRVVDQRWRKTTGTAADIDRFEYGYDKDSNVQYKQNMLSSADSELYHLDGATAGYDTLNRLTAFQRGTMSDANTDGTPDTISSESRSQTWSLDALGNWTSSATNGTSTPRTHDKRNELTAVGAATLLYDANGNLRKDENGKGLVYDAWNRLIGYDDNADGDLLDTGDTPYAADALGRRITTDPVGATPATDLYYSSDWQVLDERVGGQPKYQYVWGLGYVDDLVLRDEFATGAGSADTSFDTDGKVTTDFGGSDGAAGVAIQPDGKVVAAGYKDGTFAVARYNRDGSFDTTFDTDGKATASVPSGGQGFAMALQPDGKIVVAGYCNTNSGDFALVRFNADGSLDTSFSGDGVQTTDLGGNDAIKSVALDAKGRIVVAGWKGSDYAVARYTSSGTLDTTFDTDGWLVTDFGSGDQGNGIMVQPDGKIVVAGITGNGTQLGLARYNENGSLDTSFSGDGKVTNSSVAFGYRLALAAGLNGKILVSGANGDFTVVQYNADGTLDTSFGGGDGIASVDLGMGVSDYAYSLFVQQDGRIVLAGPSLQSSGLNKWGVARFLPDGTLDTSFDTDGWLTTDFAGADSVPADVAVANDGRIVVAGIAGSTGSDFAVTVFNGGKQRLYAQQDVNYNVTSVTDATGAVQERYLYDPYGAVTYKTAAWGSKSPSSYSWVYLHQGGRYDGSSKLYNFRRREYSQALGRWVEADPLLYTDGPNVYELTGDDPVGALDPSGLAQREAKQTPLLTTIQSERSQVALIMLTYDVSADEARRILRERGPIQYPSYPAAKDEGEACPSISAWERDLAKRLAPRHPKLGAIVSVLAALDEGAEDGLAAFGDGMTGGSHFADLGYYDPTEPELVVSWWAGLVESIALSIASTAGAPAGGTITRWGSPIEPGRQVMSGGATWRNYIFSGKACSTARPMYTAPMDYYTLEGVPANALKTPPGLLGPFYRWLGQHVYKP